MQGQLRHQHQLTLVLMRSVNLPFGMQKIMMSRASGVDVHAHRQAAFASCPHLLPLCKPLSQHVSPD
jgi:hypothetical protein